MDLEYYIKLVNGELISRNEKFHPIISDFNYFLNPAKNLKEEILNIELISRCKK